MERKIYITFILLLLFIPIQAQNLYKQVIYDAYIKGDMKIWKTTIDIMHKQPNKSHVYKMELVSYLYGYIGWCIGNERKGEARPYLDIAIKYADELEKGKYNPSLVSAYHAAFNGYSIALAPYKVIFFGTRSIKYAEKAVSQNKNNYFGYLQLGNIDFYKPPTFGGDKNRAIQYYKQAQELMEKDKISIKNDWNYLNIMVSIARAYYELGKYKEAQAYYESILRIEPRFQWVKNKLLPELLQKIKNEKK